MKGRPTEAAHAVVREVVRVGDLVVDATAGNGRDTLFLAEAVGATGKVVAFDVQQVAIEATRRRLEAAGVAERVELRLESHFEMLEAVGRDAARAVMFNLGYLPGGDHSIKTEIGPTCGAIVQGLFVLQPGGVMTVVCYTGHPGGREEAETVVMSLETIRDKESSGMLEVEVGRAEREDAPFLVTVRKG